MTDPMTDQPTPRTEAERRTPNETNFVDFLRTEIGLSWDDTNAIFAWLDAIEAQARTEALGRVRALKAKYEYSRDEATLAGIPSAASDFAAAVEACAEVLAILTQARTEAIDVAWALVSNAERDCSGAPHHFGGCGCLCHEARLAARETS